MHACILVCECVMLLIVTLRVVVCKSQLRAIFPLLVCVPRINESLFKVLINICFKC